MIFKAIGVFLFIWTFIAWFIFVNSEFTRDEGVDFPYWEQIRMCYVIALGFISGFFHSLFRRR